MEERMNREEMPYEQAGENVSSSVKMQISGDQVGDQHVGEVNIAPSALSQSAEGNNVPGMALDSKIENEGVNTEITRGKERTSGDLVKEQVKSAAKMAGSALTQYAEREAPDIFSDSTKQRAKVAAAIAKQRMDILAEAAREKANRAKLKARDIAEDERTAKVLGYARDVTRKGGNIARFGRSKVINLSNTLFGGGGGSSSLNQQQSETQNTIDEDVEIDNLQRVMSRQSPYYYSPVPPQVSSGMFYTDSEVFKPTSQASRIYNVDSQSQHNISIPNLPEQQMPPDTSPMTFAPNKTISRHKEPQSQHNISVQNLPTQLTTSDTSPITFATNKPISRPKLVNNPPATKPASHMASEYLLIDYQPQHYPTHDVQPPLIGQTLLGAEMMTGTCDDNCVHRCCLEKKFYRWIVRLLLQQELNKTNNDCPRCHDNSKQTNNLPPSTTATRITDLLRQRIATQFTPNELDNIISSHSQNEGYQSFRGNNPCANSTINQQRLQYPNGASIIHTEHIDTYNGKETSTNCCCVQTQTETNKPKNVSFVCTKERCIVKNVGGDKRENRANLENAKGAKTAQICLTNCKKSSRSKRPICINFDIEELSKIASKKKTECYGVDAICQMYNDAETISEKKTRDCESQCQSLIQSSDIMDSDTACCECVVDPCQRLDTCNYCSYDCGHCYRNSSEDTGNSVADRQDQRQEIKETLENIRKVYKDINAIKDNITAGIIKMQEKERKVQSYDEIKANRLKRSAVESKVKEAKTNSRNTFASSQVKQPSETPRKTYCNDEQQKLRVCENELLKLKEEMFKTSESETESNETPLFHEESIANDTTAQSSDEGTSNDIGQYELESIQAESDVADIGEYIVMEFCEPNNKICSRFKKNRQRSNTPHHKNTNKQLQTKFDSSYESTEFTSGIERANRSQSNMRELRREGTFIVSAKCDNLVLSPHTVTEERVANSEQSEGQEEDRVNHKDTQIEPTVLRSNQRSLQLMNANESKNKSVTSDNVKLEKTGTYNSSESATENNTANLFDSLEEFYSKESGSQNKSPSQTPTEAAPTKVIKEIEHLSKPSPSPLQLISNYYHGNNGPSVQNHETHLQIDKYRQDNTESNYILGEKSNEAKPPYTENYDISKHPSTIDSLSNLKPSMVEEKNDSLKSSGTPSRSVSSKSASSIWGRKGISKRLCNFKKLVRKSSSSEISSFNVHMLAQKYEITSKYGYEKTRKLDITNKDEVGKETKKQDANKVIVKEPPVRNKENKKKPNDNTEKNQGKGSFLGLVSSYIPFWSKEVDVKDEIRLYENPKEKKARGDKEAENKISTNKKPEDESTKAAKENISQDEAVEIRVIKDTVPNERGSRDTIPNRKSAKDTKPKENPTKVERPTKEGLTKADRPAKQGRPTKEENPKDKKVIIPPVVKKSTTPPDIKDKRSFRCKQGWRDPSYCPRKTEKLEKDTEKGCNGESIYCKTPCGESYICCPKEEPRVKKDPNCDVDTDTSTCTVSKKVSKGNSDSPGDICNEKEYSCKDNGHQKPPSRICDPYSKRAICRNKIPNRKVAPETPCFEEPTSDNKNSESVYDCEEANPCEIEALHPRCVPFEGDRCREKRKRKEGDGLKRKSNHFEDEQKTSPKRSECEEEESSKNIYFSKKEPSMENKRDEEHCSSKEKSVSINPENKKSQSCGEKSSCPNDKNGKHDADHSKTDRSCCRCQEKQQTKSAKCPCPVAPDRHTCDPALKPDCQPKRSSDTFNQCSDDVFSLTWTPSNTNTISDILPETNDSSPKEKSREVKQFKWKQYDSSSDTVEYEVAAKQCQRNMRAICAARKAQCQKLCCEKRRAMKCKCKALIPYIQKLYAKKNTSINLTVPNKKSCHEIKPCCQGKGKGRDCVPKAGCKSTGVTSPCKCNKHCKVVCKGDKDKCSKKPQCSKPQNHQDQNERVYQSVLPEKQDNATAHIKFPQKIRLTFRASKTKKDNGHEQDNNDDATHRSSPQPNSRVSTKSNRGSKPYPVQNVLETEPSVSQRIPNGSSQEIIVSKVTSNEPDLRNRNVINKSPALSNTLLSNPSQDSDVPGNIHLSRHPSPYVFEVQSSFTKTDIGGPLSRQQSNDIEQYVASRSQSPGFKTGSLSPSEQYQNYRLQSRANLIDDHLNSRTGNFDHDTVNGRSLSPVKLSRQNSIEKRKSSSIFNGNNSPTRGSLLNWTSAQNFEQYGHNPSKDLHDPIRPNSTDTLRGNNPVRKSSVLIQQGDSSTNVNTKTSPYQSSTDDSENAILRARLLKTKKLHKRHLEENRLDEDTSGSDAKESASFVFQDENYEHKFASRNRNALDNFQPPFNMYRDTLGPSKVIKDQKRSTSNGATKILKSVHSSYHTLRRTLLRSSPMKYAKVKSDIVRRCRLDNNAVIQTSGQKKQKGEIP